MKLAGNFFHRLGRAATAVLALILPAAALASPTPVPAAASPERLALEQRVERVRQALAAEPGGSREATDTVGPIAQWYNWNNWNNWNNWRNWGNWFNR
jgi:hypothetical protein